MEEVWKDIEGYEGLYEISNLGNVKSLVDSNGVAREKILKHIKARNGYLKVDLCKNKTKKHFLVHRLVANAFLPNPQNLPCVNHKDEFRTNNSVENLEWCTHKYNINFGSCIERSAKSRRNDHNRSKQVYQYSKDFELIAVWKSTRECGRNGYKQCQVVACCNGKIKSHKGYIWSYTPLNNKSS